MSRKKIRRLKNFMWGRGVILESHKNQSAGKQYLFSESVQVFEAVGGLIDENPAPIIGIQNIRPTFLLNLDQFL